MKFFWSLTEYRSPRMQGLALGLVSMCTGLWLGHWFWQDEIGEQERLHDEVIALQGQLKPSQSQSVSHHAAVLQVDELTDLDSRQAAQVWFWLEQRLRAHGLQVQVLRPGALETVSGLPAQAVQLEVQGQWRDWLAFERLLGQHAPWWTVTQWQVTPAAVEGQVRMQWHLRWGWRALHQEQASAPELPVWSMSPYAVGPAVFGEPQGRAATWAAESGHGLPSDPGLWPVRALRLQGVWQQAGVRHAVLGDGLQQLAVAPGQHVGREGYRVQGVQADEVVLRSRSASSPDVRLGLTGGSR